MSSAKSSSFMSSFTLSSNLSFGLPLLLRPSINKASTLLTEADCLSLTMGVFFQERKRSGVYSLRRSLRGTFLSQRTFASALHLSHVALIRVLLYKASNKVYYLDQGSSRHKTKLVLGHRSLSSQTSLDLSLPKLHGVTKKLDTLIVAANLRIAYVFKDMDDVTESPIFRHLRTCEDLVEEASKTSNTLIP
ncbi:hypothetical protein Tco_0733209 [Tanacetum coccineum]